MPRMNRPPLRNCRVALIVASSAGLRNDWHSVEMPGDQVQGAVYVCDESGPLRLTERAGWHGEAEVDAVARARRGDHDLRVGRVPVDDEMLVGRHGVAAADRLNDFAG